MAAFRTHFGVGAAVSGTAAVGLLVSGLLSETIALQCFVAGLAGAILPDLDAPSSRPSRALGAALSLAAACLAVLGLVDRFPSVAELTLLWLLVFVVARWLIFGVFEWLTVHRGLWHSLPAAGLAGVLGAIAVERALGEGPVVAWLCGMFLTLGFIVHLALDELMALNLLGARQRRSAGSALKLYRPGHPVSSALLYTSLAVAFLAAPATAPITALITEQELIDRIETRLLPGGGWFGLG